MNISSDIVAIGHIGIVIPAHNEANSIVACLKAMKTAIAKLPKTIKTSVIVVLDSCTDDTAMRVETFDKEGIIEAIRCDARCVGIARDMGIRHAINKGAAWIACSDADSYVNENWLMAQIAHIIEHKAEVICGVVEIVDWRHLLPATREQYLAHYQDKMGHRHIHGANLSFLAKAYEAVGGFSPLPCHEDVALVKKFETNGYTIVWSNQVRVVTSSRLNAKTEEGFGNFLTTLQQQNQKNPY